MSARRKDASPPSTGATEKDVLVGFLDYLRASVAGKLDGVDESAARTPGVPSGTTLLGLVRHLTAVEGFYFLQQKVGSWPATFRCTDRDSVASVVASYREVIDQAAVIIDAYDDLSAAAPAQPGRSSVPSMRWVLTHMIEETGRHAGHLDILRELIDGQTGR
ncbi:DinB family protein [Gordonia sp. OPL2]|uniref:DinB family protein n=1 Tax=Gordonia sp. OPL2 TaxID=2486274 RepID=UPI001656308B|nr:DinB family protein [Gordonia sp. OPL2]ROZ82914.1 DinB family protein [Gordonia sp. OPL2]